MGLLVDGVWMDKRPDNTDGRFQRPQSTYRNWVTPDGSPGPSGEGGFAAEAGRYHLYVALSCPWAHRTVIFRKLKGLENTISMSVAAPIYGDQGWEFRKEPGTIVDTANGKTRLADIYRMANARFTGKVTVPALWDKKTKTIVNNESSEIIRMLNSAFDSFTNEHADYYPEALRAEIDMVNARIYDTVNNGVYRAGFASSQAAYAEACTAIFETLDVMEERLSHRRYLAGAQITEADWRFFCTLIRFDAVYHGHFKCNLKRIADYPNLSNYLRDLYQVPGIAETVNIDHIKRHYYGSQLHVNPTGIVPLGPPLDFTSPHNRARFGN